MLVRFTSSIRRFIEKNRSGDSYVRFFLFCFSSQVTRERRRSLVNRTWGRNVFWDTKRVGSLENNSNNEATATRSGHSSNWFLSRSRSDRIVKTGTDRRFVWEDKILDVPTITVFRKKKRRKARTSEFFSRKLSRNQISNEHFSSCMYSLRLLVLSLLFSFSFVSQSLNRDIRWFSTRSW
jgi:hypothetical protein